MAKVVQIDVLLVDPFNSSAPGVEEDTYATRKQRQR